MKKVILNLTFCVLFTSVSFAQEKEIDAALSALDGKKNTEAKAELAKVSGQISSNTISPEAKAKYYYVAGKLALQSGNSVEAAKQFGELAKYETGVMYSAKNKTSKETEYFATKAEAETAVAKGDYSKIKEENLAPTYLPMVQGDLKAMAEKAIDQGNATYQNNNNDEAGNKFLEASYLIDALGGDGGLFRYNAALSYHRGQNYDKALEIYKSLINEGYTGEKTSWEAKDKDGNEVTFNSKSDADTQARLGLVSAIREIKSPSIEKEIFTNTLKALNDSKKYDAVVEKIASKYPKDTDIQSLLGNVYHNSGHDDKFLNQLIENTKLDPANASNYYNIGVIYMNQNKDAEAIQYFEKAIQVDSKYKSAYTSIAWIKIKPEAEYVEKINANLGSSAEERKIYKEFTEKRKTLYLEVIPYLEKAFELDKTDYEAAKALRQAYQNAEMFDKEDQMRAVEKSLEGK
jgi:tetratricopeptide (TPR) repeat protein